MGPRLYASVLILAFIHLSAWKVDSQKFARDRSGVQSQQEMRSPPFDTKLGVKGNALLWKGVEP